jgi:sialate O-acetylesterase
MVRYAETQRLWLQRLRAGWGNNDFYFLSVMLPGFGRTLKGGPGIGDLEAVDAHSWAIIRDSQMAVLKLPHTAVANTVDLGEEKNIHPLDKMPVGERLALLARREVYGEVDLIAAGPMFQGLEVSGRKIVVRFKDAGGLKTIDGQPPRAFWTGSDEMGWKRANAKIDGERVVLAVPPGLKPKEVRYAFAAKPRVNLVNQAGLPAYPFKAELPHRNQ